MTGVCNLHITPSFALPLAFRIHMRFQLQSYYGKKVKEF